jgi:PAS domain S-box-containing protein
VFKLTPPTNVKSLLALRWYYWLVIFFPIFVAYYSWHTVNQSHFEKSSQAFERQTNQVIALITERMKKYEDTLWSGVALFESHNKSVSHQQWRLFANSLDISNKYQGIMGIGVIFKADKKQLNKFELQHQKVRPRFKVFPEHTSEESWPITYIEPEIRNIKAVGLDMAHEQNRFDALQKSVHSGDAQITAPIVLVQDQENTPGFLFYAPIYELDRKKLTDMSRTQKNSAAIGLVYAPFIMGNLMKGTLKKENRDIGIRVLDSGTILYDEHTQDIADFDKNPLLKKTVQVDMYGRPWTLDLRSSLDFRTERGGQLANYIWILGLLVSTLLYLLFINLHLANQKTRDALLSSEKTRQAYIEESGDGYWDVNLVEDKAVLSPKFWLMFGYTPNEISSPNKIWRTLIFEEDFQLLKESLIKHIKTKGNSPFNLEVKYRHKAGHTVFVLCRGRVIEWDMNRAVRVIGSHTNVTELKQKEQELEEFAYRTSHDLRSPLVSSAKMLSMIKEQIEGGDLDTSKQYIGIVQESISKLERLVGDILELTKINHTKLVYQQIVPAELIASCLAKLKHMDNFSKVDIDIDASMYIPIHSSLSHIQIILENLITNSIKYQDLTKPHQTLSLHLIKEKSASVLIIEDNGIGIPERYRDELFQMFKRFHPKTAYGSGLGLYMVKKSVLKLNGQINYTPTTDGTRFVIRLPESNVFEKNKAST